jgi:hypothetical protein
MNCSTLDQLDERTATIAAQVAAQVSLRLAEQAPAPVLSVEAFDRIVDVAVGEAVKVMRGELDALRTELLEAEKISVVERDKDGYIKLVTTTTVG